MVSHGDPVSEIAFFKKYHREILDYFIRKTAMINIQA